MAAASIVASVKAFGISVHSFHSSHSCPSCSILPDDLHSRRMQKRPGEDRQGAL